MKRYMFAIVVLTALAVLPAAGARSMRVEPTQFVVVYAQGASLQSARAAVRAVGGTIVKENAAVGVATVCRELWLLAARGRSIPEIERILSRRYGGAGVSRMALLRALHHALFLDPPSNLQIVDPRIVIEARRQLLMRSAVRGRVTPDLIEKPDG